MGVMTMEATAIAGLMVIVTACANAQQGFDAGADAPGNDENRCAAGELAVSVVDGRVVCATTASTTQTALDASCSVYFGWRDHCDGCSSPPVKWGNVGGSRCVTGIGANDTCTMQPLGDETIQLFGLNTDGDVDSNDKFYASLHCVPPMAPHRPAPCSAGYFLNGTSTCAPFDVTVVDFIRSHCTVYFGWQDSCSGCLNAPTKWGYASDASCQHSGGGDSTCSSAVLGDQTINLFGLSPDGNVDGNDKLHLGLRCTTPTPATSMSTTTCPIGQFVVGKSGDGVVCESAAPMVVSYFVEHCTLFYGWSDNCNGCLGPPTKWGRSRVGSCNNGVGANSTCSVFTLSGQSVALFGLNPGGDVDDNDTLYVGFRCE